MSSRSLRPLLLACTALAVAAPFAPLHAQDATTASQDETQLQTIVVKGKRVKAGSVADTPLATETTAEEIADKQITSIEDLGRVAEPGVSFNRSNGAVNIRGLEGSRVLTTVDGIPVPYIFDATRSASGGVDAFSFSSLSAVDVMRGADSSRAGSGALGGVLGLRTLTADDLIRPDRDWGAIVKLTYDSSDRSFETSIAGARKVENTSVLFQGGYKKGHERETNGTVDELGATRTEANPSDYDQHNLLFKLRQELEGGHTLGLTAERFRRDRDTNAKNSQSATGNYREDDYFTQKDTERDRVSLDYEYEAQSEDAPVSNAWASLYWQKNRTMEGYTGYRSTSVIGEIGRENDNTERTVGLVGAVQKELTTGQLQHTFTFGFDIASGTSDQYSSGYDNCPGGPYSPFNPCNFLHTNQADTPKVESKRIGLYLDDDIAVAPTGLTLTPGLRFDWIRHEPVMTDAYDRNYSNPSLPDEFEDMAVSPKLRASYALAQDVEIFGQWAMGFRAPTASELYSSYGGAGTYLRLGNSDLESETSNGFEIGAKLGDEDMGARVSMFYNRYKNFIDARGLTSAEAAALGYSLASYPAGISQYLNISDAEIYGIELGAHKRFNNGFRISAGLAYAKGNDLENDTFLRSVAPIKAVASIGYDTEFWGVGADFIGVGASRDDDGKGASGTNYFQTEGYGVLDLNAWWEPEQLNGMRVTAGIYNVFDKTYYDYASVRTNSSAQAREFYSEPGRTFKISLTQKF
jgi:hemoglobin/transferrin/lactoferrin receptor protein